MPHMSMQTARIASRQAGAAPASQYAASSAVRPCTCPSSPCFQLAPGTWNQALAGVLGVSPGRPDDHPGRPDDHPGRPDDHPGHPVVEIAIYPDVVWLAARSLRAHSADHRAAC